MVMATEMVFDFPWWLRVEHFLNIIFVTFFIRSGIEILGTYPRLHTNVHNKPGAQWAEFTIKSKPKHKYYAVGSEYEDYSPIISLPGRGLLGLGRYWHFMTVMGYVTFFIIYYILLFATGQWLRYIPPSFDFPVQVFNNIVSYLAFVSPEPMPGYPFNAIQQMAYATAIFILPPYMIFTGIMQSPAVNTHFMKLTKALGGRQMIRSAHWWGLIGYLMFIIGHVSMVLLHGYGHEVSKMVFGNSDSPIAGGVIFGTGLLFVVFLHVWATRSSLEHPRKVEKLHNIIVRPLTRQLMKLESRQFLDPDNVTEHFRASGCPPEIDEYMALVVHNYEDYYLEVGGYVERPMTLTLAELREIADGYEQTTMHNCVQGFSSIGTWGGVPLHVLLDLVKPLPGATDVIFKCFQCMGRDDNLYPEGFYYDSAPMMEATQPQTLVATNLNGEDVPIKNGAPMRIRQEISCGFRSAKWVERIEVVNRYDIIGKSRGGWFEDFDNYDRMQMI